MNPDGSAQVQVTTVGEDDLYPSWSPDSTKIYFSHQNGSSFFDLASVPAVGGTTSVISSLTALAPRVVQLVGELLLPTRCGFLPRLDCVLPVALHLEVGGAVADAGGQA